MAQMAGNASSIDRPRVKMDSSSLKEREARNDPVSHCEKKRGASAPQPVLEMLTKTRKYPICHNPFQNLSHHIEASPLPPGGGGALWY